MNPIWNLNDLIPSGSPMSRLLAGGSWALLGRIVTTLSAFLVNVIVARLLLPSDVGRYFLVLSVVVFGVGFSSLGMRRAIVKVVAETTGMGEPGRTRSAIQRTFLLVIGSSVIVAGFLFLVGVNWLDTRVFRSVEVIQLAKQIALLVIINALMSLVAETFRGFHDIRLATIIGGLGQSVFPAIGLVIIWRRAIQVEIEGVLTIHILATTSALIIGGWILARRFAELSSGARYPTRDLLSTGLPLMITNIALIMQTKVAVWIIAAFLPDTELALYGVAERMIILVTTPLIVVNSVVPPIIAEMYAAGKKNKLQSFLQTASALAVIPAGIVVLSYILFGDALLSTIFGPFYNQAENVLIILSISQLASVVAGSCGLTLMMTGNQVAMMVIAVASIAIQTALGILLVSQFGIEGVGLAVGVVIILQNLIMLFYTKSRTGIWTFMRVPAEDLGRYVKRIFKSKTT